MKRSKCPWYIFPATLLFLVVAVLSSPPTAHAHGGGLNKCGCHIDHKTNTCHCHQPPYGGCGRECYSRLTDQSHGEDTFSIEVGCEPSTEGLRPLRDLWHSIKFDPAEQAQWELRAPEELPKVHSGR